MVGGNRQVNYRRVKRTKTRQQDAMTVVSLVQEIRINQRKIGTRKLYYLLHEKLQALKVGRDKFFDILGANHSLITPKRTYQKTAISNHSYLSLIIDAYSKKIVGFEVSGAMCTSHMVHALKMAQKQRNTNKALIHLSDRRVQYCSDEYQEYLKKYKITCSMTENSDPYENAIAERINGILKHEFMIDTYHLELSLMKEIVAEAIRIYNNDRPHWSNHMLAPSQMHSKAKMKYRTYKTKNSNNLMATTV